jgi:hypothetical protein
VAKNKRGAGAPWPSVGDADIPVVGGREPCPCGSGRRYKACHGRAAATLVRRPFEGLAGECDWVALKEIVPSATAALTLAPEQAKAADGRPVTLATVLPLAWPALVRTDGAVFVGLQTPTSSDDASRDIADSLLRALASEHGSPVPPSRPGPGPRLQDVLVADAPLEVTVHSGFDFWIEGSGAETTDDVAASLERATPRSSRPAGSPASRRRTGAASVPRSTCAGSCRTTRSRCSTRSPACTSRAATPGRRHAADRHLPRPRPARAGLGPRARGRGRRRREPAAAFAARPTEALAATGDLTTESGTPAPV